jgi:hypothetical protein
MRKGKVSSVDESWEEEENKKSPEQILSHFGFTHSEHYEYQCAFIKKDWRESHRFRVSDKSGITGIDTMVLTTYEALPEKRSIAYFNNSGSLHSPKSEKGVLMCASIEYDSETRSELYMTHGEIGTGDQRDPYLMNTSRQKTGSKQTISCYYSQVLKGRDKRDFKNTHVFIDELTMSEKGVKSSLFGMIRKLKQNPKISGTSYQSELDENGVPFVDDETIKLNKSMHPECVFLREKSGNRLLVCGDKKGKDGNRQILRYGYDATKKDYKPFGIETYHKDEATECPIIEKFSTLEESLEAFDKKGEK